MPTNTYESPLSSRYASEEMLYLFSADKKFSTWRKLWVALARAEMELGLPVTQEQVDELEAHIYDIDYEKAAAWEKKLRHDVMAHVHTYGELCPKAMPIIQPMCTPTESCAPRPCPSSIWGPPAATWGTTPT